MITQLSDREIRERRATKMGMIFQDPATSLNPTMKVGPQIAETMQVHLGFDEQTARKRAVEILGRVGIRRPRRVTTIILSSSAGECDRGR